MVNIKQRFLTAFHNENGGSTLETIIIIGIIVVICSFLMTLLWKTMDFGKTREGFYSTTGWFKTKDTTGMMQ